MRVARQENGQGEILEHKRRRVELEKKAFHHSFGKERMEKR